MKLAQIVRHYFKFCIDSLSHLTFFEIIQSLIRHQLPDLQLSSKVFSLVILHYELFIL